MVSVQDFLCAFSQQWNDDRQRHCEALRFAYRDDKTCTAYMLGKKKADFSDTFFDRLAGRLHQQAIAQRQTLDVVYYTTGVRAIPYRNREYPARLNVIIEHENGNEIEREMWKLVMWRAPLKVLIFYDWPDDERTEKPPKARWLEDKLDALLRIRSEVGTLWPEADETTYLFLVGRPPQRGVLPVWWYADSSNPTLRRLRQKTRKFRNQI